MTTPHKWADVIKAWADGKPIQWRAALLPSDDDRWGDVTSSTKLPDFSAKHCEWRIKPETVKYRRYLARVPACVVVAIVHQPYTNGTAEKSWGEQFIRWIDDEWQEEEV